MVRKAPLLPEEGVVMRHDLKRFPKRLYEEVRRELLALQLQTGASIPMKAAFVRGATLALEELRKAPLETLKRIYVEGDEG